MYRKGCCYLDIGYDVMGQRANSMSFNVLFKISVIYEVINSFYEFPCVYEETKMVPNCNKKLMRKSSNVYCFTSILH